MINTRVMHVVINKLSIVFVWILQ